MRKSGCVEVSWLFKLGWCFGVLCILGLYGCDKSAKVFSRQNGFSANPSSKNVAVLMSGSGEQHIPKNVAMIREVLSDPSAGYNFTIVEQQKVSAEQAVQITADAAREVGDGGTLFWYFSSHGAPDGSLQTRSRMLKLKQITEGIKNARGGVPLKRLVVVVQACYSGQIVNGSAKVESYASIPPTVALDGTLPDETLRDLFVDRDELADTRDSYATPDYGQLAEQILVLSASSKSEMSQYSSDGSHFTKALHKTFKELGSSPGSTMREFLEQVQKNVRSSRPQYRAEPEDVILGEPLRHAMNAQRRYIYAFFNDRSELWVKGVEPLSQVNFCLGVSPDAARACAQAMQGVSSQGMFYLPLNIPNTAREYYVGIDGRYYGANDNVLQLVKIKRRQS